jgi:hypothetical protein
MTPIIDPRRGDVEDDASSTKQRSLLSLAGSLLAEISLPKLAVAWMLLVGLPALLLGVAPLVFSIWFATLSKKAAYALSGVGSLLLLIAVIAVGWFGGRRVFRVAERSFWSLNSLAVQPAYALVREVLRHVVEKLLPANATGEKRSALRAIVAAMAGLAIFVPALWLVAGAWPATLWVGTVPDLASPWRLAVIAAANSFVLVASYFGVAALAWGLADATMDQRAISKPRRSRRASSDDGVSRTYLTSISWASATDSESKVGDRGLVETIGCIVFWRGSTISTRPNRSTRCS